MQLDMHYYGTYAMARAAGLTPNAAKTIGTCAQFVDDNVARTTLEFDSGARVVSVATAHHAVDLVNNLDLDDQRRVWVPFHFIPGNIGNSFTERLKCRKDSQIAQEMVEHHLSFADKPFGLELMGIAAHVYADTFSHYGFSGVSSRGNKVVNNSFKFTKLQPEMEKYILEKQERFQSSKGAKLRPNFRDDVRGKSWWERMKNTVMSWVAEEGSGALGHGSVATFPDRPYLCWSYLYERDDASLEAESPDAPRLSQRYNPETFLEGCEALHERFVRYREKAPSHDNKDGREFSSIRDAVLEILILQADKAGRIKAWQKAAQDGSVFGGGGEPIPEYNGTSWNDAWEALNKGPDAKDVIDKPVWHFYQAASIHRTFVLRDLLPAHGLVVD